MPDTLRWGILSTARIGRNAVIPAIRASHNGQVVAVASRDPAKARAFADELGIEHAHAGYQALIDDPAVDAIYNPLPNDGHAPWTIAALRAGKHVLVEKPMALNAAEAQTMADAARESGKLLMEAFMYRYHPQHARVRDLIADGSIGKLNLISAAFTFALSPDNTTNVRLQPDMGGGGLMDVGCYCVQAIRLISGQMPESVSGFARYTDRGVDVGFVGILRFASGLLAHFDCGMDSAGRNYYTAVGDGGRITTMQAFRPDADASVLQVTRDETSESITIPAANQYTLMVEDFAHAALTGGQPRYSPDDGVQNMRILDALALSARESRVVTL